MATFSPTPGSTTAARPARYAPDYRLLGELLSIPIAALQASESGRFARAIDAWVAQELRRAGFGPTRYGPGHATARLPRDIAVSAGEAPAGDWRRSSERGCQASPRSHRSMRAFSGAPTRSRLTSASRAGSAGPSCSSAPRRRSHPSGRTFPTASRRLTAMLATCAGATRWRRSASSLSSGPRSLTQEPEAFERTVDMMRKLRDTGDGNGYTATGLVLVEWDDSSGPVPRSGCAESTRCPRTSRAPSSSRPGAPGPCNATPVVHHVFVRERIERRHIPVVESDTEASEAP